MICERCKGDLVRWNGVFWWCIPCSDYAKIKMRYVK